MTKILPLLEKLKTNCQQFGIFHQFLSIDESTIPYRGLHSAKQFVKGKPVKFGNKMWMFCSADDFPYKFDEYCGKDPLRTGLLGIHVVDTMLQPAQNNKQHVVFFDNFFTSHQLLHSLTERNTRACGTKRENRTGHCPLMTNKNAKKKARGAYDYRSDRTIVCVKWNDSCPVVAASNFFGISPVQKAERTVKRRPKRFIDQPFIIKMYNEGVGGLDVCDRLLSSYRPRLQSKKWWWNLFSNLLNLSVVASFRFYNFVNQCNPFEVSQGDRYQFG